MDDEKLLADYYNSDTFRVRRAAYSSAQEGLSLMAEGGTYSGMARVRRAGEYTGNSDAKTTRENTGTSSAGA